METVPKNVHWLIPEESSPCDIFLQFRGQYALGIAAGKPISYDFLHKLAKAQYFHVYIRKEDEPTWSGWTANRHPKDAEEPKSGAEGEESGLYGNKRAEYLSFMQKIVTMKDSSDTALESSFRAATQFVQKVVKLPTLDWYFQQFHEPPDLFHHGARVTYPLTVFCLHNGLVPEKELEALVFSSVIHELEGDPVENLKTVVSEQTLKTLEKQGRPVPQEVIALIRAQDELCSGRGFPDKKTLKDIPVAVRAFSMFNHFDHYRLKSTGTRRARFDATKRQMESRKEDYDSTLWFKFWAFWEKQAEAVS